MNLFPGLLSRMNDDNGFLMGFDLIRVNSRRKWNAETSNAGPVHPNSLRSRVKVSSLRRNIAISPTLQRSIHGHCPVTSTIEAKCDVRDRYVVASVVFFWTNLLSVHIFLEIYERHCTESSTKILI